MDACVWMRVKGRGDTHVLRIFDHEVSVEGVHLFDQQRYLVRNLVSVADGAIIFHVLQCLFGAGNVFKRFPCDILRHAWGESDDVKGIDLSTAHCLRSDRKLRM